MMVDIVSKGIVYMHLFLVALMAMVGTPQILLYTSLLWGVCSYMSIPLCEEWYFIELPSIWKYRHLLGLGVVYTLLIYNMPSMT